MTHYIGDAFAHRPGENRFDRQRQGEVFGVGMQLDPGRGKGFAGAGQFGA